MRLVDESLPINVYGIDPRLRAIAHEMGKGRGRPVALGPFRYRHPIGAVPLCVGQARADRRPEINPITDIVGRADGDVQVGEGYRSEEHTSELQSLMRITYAGFCLKKKNKTQHINS